MTKGQEGSQDVSATEWPGTKQQAPGKTEDSHVGQERRNNHDRGLGTLWQDARPRGWVDTLKRIGKRSTTGSTVWAFFLCPKYEDATQTLNPTAAGDLGGAKERSKRKKQALALITYRAVGRSAKRQGSEVFFQVLISET